MPVGTGGRSRRCGTYGCWDHSTYSVLPCGSSESGSYSVVPEPWFSAIRPSTYARPRPMRRSLLPASAMLEPVGRLGRHDAATDQVHGLRTQAAIEHLHELVPVGVELHAPLLHEHAGVVACGSNVKRV